MAEKLKRLTVPRADEDVEELELSYAAGAKLYNQFAKLFDSILKN